MAKSVQRLDFWLCSNSSPGIASYSWNLWTFSTGSYLSSLWTSSTGSLGDFLHAGRLAAGKGRHAYIPIKMASGVQDITCVFVEVAGSYEKNFNLTVSWDGV